MNDTLKIEYIPLDQLTSFEKNSKVHTKKQLEHIANSIRAFGFNDPLAIAGPNNTILEGNGRIEAARLLGMPVLPCVRLDHLSAEEQRAYVIAHNALCLETGFDDAMLFAELDALKDYDFGNYGLKCEKYTPTIERLEKKILPAMERVYYLVSVDINYHDKIAGMLAAMRNTEGVRVRANCD